MKWLRTILDEVFGLFVDDSSFALVILIWVGVVTGLHPRTGWLLPWRGLILFCGLAMILSESAARYARGKPRGPGRG